MKKALFVTGTDTDVGKTFVTGLLMLAANQLFPTHYLKPIQTGMDSDTETIKTITNLPANHFYDPCYHFAEPASPNRAAKTEGIKIDINKIIQTWEQLPHGHYVLEGAGGLMVPLVEKILIRDLIKNLNTPTVIVARTRLGTINHTLLTVEAARNKNLNIKGVILNGVCDPGLKESLQEQDINILAEIPHLEIVTTQSLYKLAEQVFPASLIQELFA